MRSEGPLNSTDFNLVGRRVLVTGAAHGMGRSHCEFMAARGAIVAAIDVDAAELADLPASAVSGPGKIVTFTADVSDRTQVETAVEALALEMGGLDAVVSNAGNVHTVESLEDTDDEIWDLTFAVHVGGARNVCRSALPWLRRSHTPRIVIVSSLWAQRGPGYGYAYCSAKGALLAFARNAAIEFAPDGILVNSVAPGSVPTRMAEGITDAEIAAVADVIPLGRWGEAVEISKLVAFLASQEVSYVTGQMISINGGEVLAGG